MKLQEQMDAYKQSFVEKVPEQVVETMMLCRDKIRDSGIADRVVTVGDKAPDFSLPDTSNNEVGLRTLLANGPVVLVFFRGRW